MSHDHHGHSHANVSHLSRAFFAAFVLNIAFAAIEAGYGWHIGSLALLSDAGHNLSDTLNIALSGLAVWAASRRPGGRYTYGYRRGTIFATLVNAVFLVATSLWLIWE